MLYDIISACIIMHNMIIEDEYDTHGSIVDLNVCLFRKLMSRPCLEEDRGRDTVLGLLYLTF